MVFVFIIGVILCIVIFNKIVKPYAIKYDTVTAFTGGLGSGKTFFSVKTSLKLLRKNRRKVKRHNFFHPLNKWEKPLLYSSIPLRISKKEYAEVLTVEHLLLLSKLVPRSVVFIDEIGSFANQFEYKNPAILTNFNEFIRLFRHYTLGGYLVCNDQCSENIVLEVRRRINTVFNLMYFRKFLCFALVKCRNINISEEIKTVEEGMTEDGFKNLFALVPLRFKHYDTYCYSNRYTTVPQEISDRWSVLKTNRLIQVPAKAPKPYTATSD